MSKQAIFLPSEKTRFNDDVLSDWTKSGQIIGPTAGSLGTGRERVDWTKFVPGQVLWRTLVGGGGKKEKRGRMN
jgi:hypothetical protein